MVRLAEQMGHAKAEVETGIAEVDDFVVEQNQPVLVHQHILRAEVAVDNRVLPGVGVVDQPPRKTRPPRAPATGGVPVIRLNPQRFEEIDRSPKTRLQVRLTGRLLSR